jgi:hypothetical protein
MTPKAIVDRLEVMIGVDGKPRPLLSAVETELSGHFGLPPICASEWAEQMTPAVARVILSRAADSERAGVVSALTLVGTTSDWADIRQIPAVSGRGSRFCPP